MNSLLRDELDVVSKQAVANNEKDKSHIEGIDEEKQIPESKSNNESGYSGPTHFGVRCLNCDALEENEKRRLGRLIND